MKTSHRSHLKSVRRPHQLASRTSVVTENSELSPLAASPRSRGNRPSWTGETSQPYQSQNSLQNPGADEKKPQNVFQARDEMESSRSRTDRFLRRTKRDQFLARYYDNRDIVGFVPLLLGLGANFFCKGLRHG